MAQKRKDINSIELYKEYISSDITFAELGRKYSCDDKTIRYRIIRVHEQLKKHYGRYDINLVGAINQKPLVEMQLARRGIVNVIDLMIFVSKERLSNIKGITRATEGYILKDLSVRSNQLREEILGELLDIYEKQHDGILPLTIIVSRKEYKVMVHSSKKYSNKIKLTLQYKRDSICVQDKFYISCNKDLYDPYNPLIASTKEAKYYIHKKETKKYEENKKLDSQSQVSTLY